VQTTAGGVKVDRDESREMLEKFLSDIDKNIESYFRDIPDEVTNVMVEQALKDAKRLFKNAKNEDIKQVTYYIYRAYLLGMLIERMNNKSKSGIVRNNVIKLVK
jgi:HPt (histidine-containing phosphotransfer) domain-containing protein